MKGGDTTVQTQGFTIVEVMVVLAVTLAIFASAIVYINGREANAAFTDETQQVQSQLQSVIDDVSSGYYNYDNSQFTCNTPALSPFLSITPNNIGSTPEQQATNNDGCTYLGEAIQFVANSNTYYTYDMLGLRQTASGALPSSYAVAYPTASDTIANLSTSQSLGNELKVAWMSYSSVSGVAPVNGGGDAIGTVAILNDPAPTTSGSFVSGSSGSIQLNVIPVANTSLNDSQDAVAGAGPTGIINNRTTGFATTADSNINPPGGVGICFASQSTNQSVLLLLGGASRRASLEAQTFDGGVC